MAAPLPEPFATFDRWLRDAEARDEIKYANAVNLATVGADGSPDARIVLLESFDADGFVFFTDVESKKARDLEHRPEAAMTFYWGVLDRQVRIRGTVELLGEDEAEACFRRRPRASQVTAWASRQSRTLDSPEALQARYDKEARRLEGVDPLPCPPRWRAFRLKAHAVEFWEARPRRLHERRLYTLGKGGWNLGRLEP